MNIESRNLLVFKCFHWFQKAIHSKATFAKVSERSLSYNEQVPTRYPSTPFMSSATVLNYSNRTSDFLLPSTRFCENKTWMEPHMVAEAIHQWKATLWHRQHTKVRSTVHSRPIGQHHNFIICYAIVHPSVSVSIHPCFLCMLSPFIINKSRHAQNPEDSCISFILLLVMSCFFEVVGIFLNVSRNEDIMLHY